MEDAKTEMVKTNFESEAIQSTEISVRPLAPVRNFGVWEFGAKMSVSSFRQYMGDKKRNPNPNSKSAD